MADLVDRNIKQRFLPFVQDPGITKGFDSEAKDLTDGTSVQCWSYRKRFTETISDNATIKIIPNDHNYFDKDIGNSLQAGSFTSERGTMGITTIADILMNIPCVQIREYTQDTRIDMVLSLLGMFKKGFQTGGEVAKQLATIEDIAAYNELITYDMRNMQKSSLMQDILKELDASFSGFGNNLYSVYSKNSDQYVLLNFCYTLYYRLLTTTTSNIYEVPYNGSHLHYGNGSTGFSGQEGLGFEDVIGGMNGIVKDALGFIAPNIRIVTTPIWKGIKGGEGIDIELQVNLFNDTLDGSVANFIFVNTIMPQNLPVQYAIFQGPPSLYDLKIEGGPRLFMCSGNFKCEYKGVLRQPSKGFVDKLKKYVNTNVISQSTVEEMVKNSIIKIPDVYTITMSFKSLLPNVFNNFMFRYSINNNIIPNRSATQKGLDSMDNVTNKINDWLKTRADDIPAYLQAKQSAEQEVIEAQKNVDSAEMEKTGYEDMWGQSFESFGKGTQNSSANKQPIIEEVTGKIESAKQQLAEAESKRDGMLNTYKTIHDK